MTWAYVLYSYILLPALAVAYMVFGFWLAYRLASKAKSGRGKLATVVLTTLLFMTLPAADLVLGRAKFSNLCHREAAVRVFRTAVLDTKYFSADGSLKTHVISGRPGMRIGERYLMTSSREDIGTWPRIQRSLTRITDAQQDAVLGEVVDFHYWGGWLVQRLPGHRSAESCPQVRGRRSIERLIFQPVT